ncbi:DUF3667 domain-containing protein [Psychroserpens sp. NJDZ02]|uniref:DUF3667 domain-containing protein n=1 Tax=Psychroserpens sp. NJDZ02 TaxID=2570561 RepID=UPI0010A8C111|nr:DUF3667 domain-containing protein [Psychroserpens sp. NJDZ02]QCE42727.1 DUF3667 domain-containing protein [Psychroserpens sp. NJDZ02]
MSLKYSTCKNCESDFKSGFDFCPHCGMKDKEDLTLGILFNNTLNNYLLWDSKFFKSFIPLMIKPGFLSNQFIGGKRLSYLHPAQLYLFITFVFFFLFSFQTNRVEQELNDGFKTESTKLLNEVQTVEVDSVKRAEIKTILNKNKYLSGMTDKEIDSIVSQKDLKSSNSVSFGYSTQKIDSLLAVSASEDTIYKAMGMTDNPGWFDKMLYPQMLKFHKDRKAGSIWVSMINATPIALFILLPLFALFLKLFYWKKGRYAYHLVFSFHFFAFIFMVFSLLLIANLIIDVPNWINLLITLSVFFYFVISTKRFYNQRWRYSILKSGIISFVFLALLVPIAFVVLAFVSFLFY